MTQSKPEQKKQAMITALRILSASAKSRNQLKDRLLEKGYPQSVVQETLQQLEGQNLLNDNRLAHDVVNRLRIIKRSGKQRISFELKKRGISEDVREEVLQGIDEESENTAAFELARERWDKLEKRSPKDRRKKVYDFLIRRGFGFQVARAAVEELEREPDAS